MLLLTGTPRPALDSYRLAEQSIKYLSFQIMILVAPDVKYFVFEKQ